MGEFSSQIRGVSIAGVQSLELDPLEEGLGIHPVGEQDHRGCHSDRQDEPPPGRWAAPDLPEQDQGRKDGEEEHRRVLGEDSETEKRPGTDGPERGGGAKQEPEPEHREEEERGEDDVRRGEAGVGDDVGAGGEEHEGQHRRTRPEQSKAPHPDAHGEQDGDANHHQA